MCWLFLVGLFVLVEVLGVWGSCLFLWIGYVFGYHAGSLCLWGLCLCLCLEVLFFVLWGCVKVVFGFYSVFL